MNKELLFNQTIQNIISNCIPHENVTCGDRNPSWIDETIQKLVLHKKCTYIAYSRNNDDLFHEFQSLQAYLKAKLRKSIIYTYLANY